MQSNVYIERDNKRVKINYIPEGELFYRKEDAEVKKEKAEDIKEINFLDLLSNTQKKKLYQQVYYCFKVNEYDPYVIQSKLPRSVIKLINENGTKLFDKCIELLKTPKYIKEIEHSMRHERRCMDNSPASEKQLNYLNDLGYNGNPPKTKTAAAHAINRELRKDRLNKFESREKPVDCSSDKLFEVKLLKRFNEKQLREFFRIIIKSFDANKRDFFSIYDNMTNELLFIINKVEMKAFTDCIIQLKDPYNERMMRKYMSDRNAALSKSAPTEKQLQFLISLKYDGPIPKNRLEASKIIDDCLSCRKMYGKR